MFKIFGTYICWINIQNVNNTGTKYVRIMQQNAFWRGRKRRVYTTFKIFSTYICWINIQNATLEVSGAVRPLYGPLGVKGLITDNNKGYFTWKHVTFMIASRWILLVMRNALDKLYIENKKKIMFDTPFFPKIVPLMRYVEKHCRARKVTGGNIIRHSTVHAG